MPVLPVAEKWTCASDFQTSHCNFETGAKFRIFPNGLKSPCCNIRKFFASCKCKIRIRAPWWPAYSAPDLMQLRKAHSVCIFNNKRITIRHIHTRFNNSCANENINITWKQIVPNRWKLFFTHLPVRNSYPRLRNSFFYHHSFMLNCFHIIMQIIALSAAIYLTLHCFLQNFSVVFNNISLNRVPFARCFFNKAHISYPAHCHI